jgi:citrate lyase subunit beta/citryl-CoA lyase
MKRKLVQPGGPRLNHGAVRLLQLEIRSKLFVPGSKPELFAKAARSDADAISFDLEDAVSSALKNEARQAVREFLSQHARENDKINIVRVNSVATDLFHSDAEQVIVQGLHVMNLPKVQGREDVLCAVKALEHWERKTGLKEEIGLLATIESPKGLRMAYEIASAHPRVVGLQIGMADLNLSCGFESGNRAAANAMRLVTRIAASEAGICVFDSAFLKVDDPAAFRADAEDARGLGMNGKSCIHPSQVPITNQVFSPGPEEIERARNVLSAATKAGARGSGAFLHEGEMVDLPLIERARAVLARAGQGAIPAASDTK